MMQKNCNLNLLNQANDSGRMATPICHMGVATQGNIA